MASKMMLVPIILVAFSVFCYAEETTEPAPFTIPGLPEFALPEQLGQVATVLGDFVGNVSENVNAIEWGMILLLAGLAFFFMRANFWVQMILKFMAVLFVIAIFAIVFGVINL